MTNRYGLAANILTVTEFFDIIVRDFSANSNRLTIVFIQSYLGRKPRV